MKDTNDFHKKLITIIDKVLKESFGESSLLIYSWLKIHSVYPEEIPEKLDAFVDALKIFSAGGSVLEAIILKGLYSSYGLEFKQTKRELQLYRSDNRAKELS